MNRLKDGNTLVALVLFVVSFAVYAATTSQTIAFWDCGEFVATAYGLGIPHQPGTPLYVLVGRLFSLLPLGIPVAFKINLMSGFFAALAVVMIYLTSVRLQLAWQEEKENPSPMWLVRAGAAVGAGFLALSHTFWNSAIEAEVYSLSAFVMGVTSYLSVRWYELRERPSAGWIYLLIVYVLGLSVGFHLGSILVYPGLFILALSSRDKSMQDIDIWIMSMAMGTFVLSTMVAWDGFIAVLLVACVGMAVWRMVTPNGSGLAMAGIALFMLGLTVHLFMLIRTTQDPFINQSVPDTFERLMSVIRREQYPPRVPWHREAPLWWQFGHLWGSSFWGEGTSLAGNRVIGYLQQFTFLPPGGVAGFLNKFFPTALWLYGLFNLWRGNKRLFASFFTVLMINSLGLMIMLNFTDHEVRDRDYFYFGAFQFAALFIGQGAGGVLRTLWLGFQGWPSRRIVTASAAALMILLAFLPILLPGHSKWYEHDRTGNSVARNYGYNMLVSLPRDAILFTNGDNDTFPLWFLQEVEKMRPDVRVVNLSLINVAWYIKQLRDIEPSVPMNWTDAQIEGHENVNYQGYSTTLTPKLLRDNSILYVRDMAVWHIIQTNNWKRPIYFAVTIPPDYIRQYMPYFSMEGLVYRLTPDKNQDGGDDPKVDTNSILANLLEHYDMDGVVSLAGVGDEYDDEIDYGDEGTGEGEPGFGGAPESPNLSDTTWRGDFSRYRDHNTSHLLRNYPAALCRAGYQEMVAGNIDKAIELLEMAFAIDPGFPYVVSFLPVAYLEAKRPDAALEVAQTYLETLPDPRSMAVDVGENLLLIGENERAEIWARHLIETDPEEPGYQRLLVRALWRKGERYEAIAELESYIRRSGDANAQAELEEMRRALEERQEPGAAPSDSAAAGASEDQER